VVKHIVSFSGGKDSTAMLLRMLELGMQIDEIVFADTKLEFPEILQHIKKVEKYIGRKVTILRTKDNWNKWFYGNVTRGKMKGKMRGFPLTLFPCWWSREAKYKMLDPFCKGHIRYIGIAYDEPKRIRNKEGYKYPLFEWKWTEKDCIEYLRKKGLLADIHLRFGRTGCWCCPKQSKKSFKSLYKHYPHLWDKLRQMEKDSPIRPDFKLEEIEEVSK